MTNPTARKFGYPHTQVAETDHWLVLVRPQQPTLGSLVLVCKDSVEAFADLGAEAFADLKVAIGGIEAVLSRVIAYERINYLMLMMVDRDVHFHVVPRYDGAREHEGRSFPDAGWPGPPELASSLSLDAEAAARLARLLGDVWINVGAQAR